MATVEHAQRLFKEAAGLHARVRHIDTVELQLNAGIEPREAVQQVGDELTVSAPDIENPNRTRPGNACQLGVDASQDVQVGDALGRRKMQVFRSLRGRQVAPALSRHGILAAP